MSHRRTRPQVHRAFHAERRQRRALALMRRGRLSLPAEVTLAQERGLLGALIMNPAMIGAMAALRPPAWFVHIRCMVVMRALCCVFQNAELRVDHVVGALERHGELVLAGGRGAVEALLRPGPDLEAGRAELTVARLAPTPVEAEPIVTLASRLLEAVPCARDNGL